MSLFELNNARKPPAFLDLLVNLPNMRGALDTVIKKLRAREGFTLFTLNLDHVVKLGESRAFREAYQRANFITADGWPVVWLIEKERRAQRALAGAGEGGVPRERRAVERTTGADLLAPMCQQSAMHGLAMYFVGPGPVSQAAGIEILGKRHPGLIVAGAEAPQLPANLDDATITALAERITKSGARICVLSLGAPKQEVLADALFSKCPGVGFICVGAALDFISGHAVRAPNWARQAKLEWAWRMVSDPRRLVSRYARCAVALFKLTCPSVFPNTPRVRLSESA